MNILPDVLYEPYEDEKKIFGEHWCGPNGYEHGKFVRIAHYDAEEGGDGQPVDVHCCAMPARFYTIKALPAHNSIGEPKKPFQLGTGSGVGMAELAAKMAEAIFDGMLRLDET